MRGGEVQDWVFLLEGFVGGGEGGTVGGVGVGVREEERLEVVVGPADEDRETVAGADVLYLRCLSAVTAGFPGFGVGGVE